MSAEQQLAALLGFAQKLTQFPGDKNAWSNLIVRVQLLESADACRELLNRFSLYPDISVPLWVRLAHLEKDNFKTVFSAASASYAMGADEDALELTEVLLEAQPDHLEALELKALLTPDSVTKKEIFERILKIDPGNRVAVDNLIMLGILK